MSTFQICVNCGVQPGYPHKPECPRPKYYGDPDCTCGANLEPRYPGDGGPTEHGQECLAWRPLYYPAWLVKELDRHRG